MKKSLFFLTGLIVLLVVANNVLQKKLEALLRDRSQHFAVEPRPPENTEDVPPGGSVVSFRKGDQSVVRRDRLSINRDYKESIFYLGEEEVAWQKVVDGKIVEATGKIPDGKVKFEDESRRIHGVEYYGDGKKDGPSSAYYPDGRLFEEGRYRHGKLLWKKEYYNDGNLRLEIDYQDARDHGDDVEVGRGKLYYRGGTLKYEWQLTNSAAEGFKKSYDQKGALRGALYFDKDGKLIE